MLNFIPFYKYQSLNITNLQKAAHKLNRLITEYGLTISIQKTKSVTFKGRDKVRTKIVIDNRTM